MNSQCHPGDIAGTHRTGQGRGQRLKMRRIPFVQVMVVLARHHFDGMTKKPHLRKLKIQRKEKTGSQQQQNEPLRTPDVRIYKR